MKRLLLLTAAGLTVVALAGAVGLPDLAGAQDATSTPDSITVNGVGTVDAVPNEAQMSFGAETRRDTAQAAVAANGDAMRKILNALRQAGGRELATQWVSVYPYTDETGQVNGYVGLEQRVGRERRRRRAGTDRRGHRGRRQSDLRARPQLVERRGALPAGAREGRRRRASSTPRRSRRRPVARSARSPRSSRPVRSRPSRSIARPPRRPPTPRRPSSRASRRPPRPSASPSPSAEPTGTGAPPSGRRRSVPSCGP